MNPLKKFNKQNKKIYFLINYYSDRIKFIKEWINEIEGGPYKSEVRKEKERIIWFEEFLKELKNLVK
jgi:hypothetical protein